MTTAKEILVKLNKLKTANDEYLSTTYDMTEEQEDALLEKINKLEDEAVAMVVEFVGDKIDEKTIRKLVVFYSDKLIEILKKAQSKRGY